MTSRIPSRHEFSRRVASIAGAVFLAGAALSIGGCATTEDTPRGEVADAHAEPEDPVAQLEKEHDLIVRVVRALEVDVEMMRETGRADQERAARMVDFFTNFTDGCHHRKEERYLFPAMREQGLDRPLIDRLLADHREGRQLLGRARGVIEENPSDGATRLAAAFGDYVAMMHRHIEAENDDLFQDARRNLTDQQRIHLAEGFERIERVELGRGFHERYHALAMDLIDGEHAEH